MCKSLTIRAIIGIVAIVMYSISIVTLAGKRDFKLQDYNISSILLQPILLIIIIFISLTVLYYITILNRSVLSSLAVPLILYQLSFITHISHLILLITTILSFILIIILIIRAISKGGGDAIISYNIYKQHFRKIGIPYTLISSFIFTLYIYLYIINYPYNINGLLFHILISIISFIISYNSYSSVVESLISGIISGLGPVGYAIITTWYANRPIPINSRCGGMIVGDLVAIEGRATTNRSILRSHRSYWSSKTFLCSSNYKAEIDISVNINDVQPAILWLYGAHSTIIYNYIINRNKLNEHPILIINLDSKGPPIEKIEEELAQITSLLANRGKATLNLGSIEDQRIKITTVSTIINTIPKYDNLLLIIDVDIIYIVDLLSIIRLAIEKASLIMVAVRNPLWIKESLIPVSLNIKQGFIVSGIKDPMTALKVSSSFLETGVGAQELKDFIQIRGMGLGYPLCNNGAFIFKY